MRWSACSLICVTLALSGCASVPLIAFDATPTSPDELAVQTQIQGDIAKAPLVPGNRVALLRDGEQAFPAMFAAMAAARSSINLEYYVFDDVRSGDRTLGDVLVDRLRNGVAVNVIYDSYGSSATPAAFLERLKQAGATLTAFNAHPLARGRIDSPNDRDHRKIMVVDGRIAFLGGINLDHVYEIRTPAAAGDPGHTHWRDTAARIDGPVVAAIQRVFFTTWESQKGAPVPARDYFPTLATMGEQTVRILASTPGDGQPLYYVSALRALHAARHRIGLSTGYFVPTHQEREELANAARRGVQVRLVLPSVSDSDDALAAGRAAYDDLLEAGVRIFEVQNAVLHSKFVVIDGVWLAVGSSNFDNRSVVFNNEVDAVVLGSAARDGEAVLDEDVRMAKEIDLRTWRARPLADRMHEVLVRFWDFML